MALNLSAFGIGTQKKELDLSAFGMVPTPQKSVGQQIVELPPGAEIRKPQNLSLIETIRQKASRVPVLKDIVEGLFGTGEQTPTPIVHNAGFMSSREH